jgi:Zn-dependent peptidase ImmA (M78 family)/transcriptional regulator with XRE-family HTH domain
MNLSFNFVDSRVVNGLRVRQAREQALQTQADLAKAVSVSQPMIAHIEQGLKQSSPELAEKIATATKVKREFLFRPSGPALPLGSMLFRARADVSARKFAQTHAIATNVFEMFLHLAGRFELPPVKLKPISGPPEQAAALTRGMLGLDRLSPIPHLMRAFEKAGGVLLSLPELQGREAFAVWEASRPIIGIGPSSSGDRLRFSMAHEIGHLILHNAPTAMIQAEKEAHRFAAELLAPQEAITDDLCGILTFEKLGQLKRKWGISMAAILYRAKELHLVPRRSHDRLIIEMSRFKTQEPSEFNVPLEKPRGLRQMAEVLFGSNSLAENLADDLALSKEFVQDVLARYASEEEIAASNRRRKVVNIQSGRKRRMKSDIVMNPAIGSKG